MTITVAKLKRALEETATHENGFFLANKPVIRVALRAIINNPTALTILAEKLSERPDSDDSVQRAALQNQLFGLLYGRGPATYIARKDCPTALGDVCKQGPRCCQRDPEIAHKRNENWDKPSPPADFKDAAWAAFPPPRNAARSGFLSFFEGRARDNNPFPPARPDLLKEYQIGWDAAQEHMAF